MSWDAVDFYEDGGDGCNFRPRAGVNFTNARNKRRH